SSSDNTDPSTNGRTYTYGVSSGNSCPTQLCGQLDPSQVYLDSGNAYRTSQYLGVAVDSSANPFNSGLRLFEDWTEIGPAHTAHPDMRAYGGGRFSKWNTALIFSPSDNSDPRSNGRRYIYAAPSCSPIQLTIVDDTETHYGTFHSHNQK